MNESCKTCAFFEPEAHDNNTEGTCHRYAPRPTDAYMRARSEIAAAWPIVMGTKWCGEWKSVGQ